MSTLADLFDLLHEVMAQTWPGRTARRLLIETLEGDRIVLPVPMPAAAPRPGPSAAAAGASPAAPDEPKPGQVSGWDRLCQDILATLEEAGRPLTATRLLSEMARKGREWSRRYAERALKTLMDEGALVNDPRGRPPGYWLADVPYPTEGQQS